MPTNCEGSDGNWNNKETKVKSIKAPWKRGDRFCYFAEKMRIYVATNGGVKVAKSNGSQFVLIFVGSVMVMCRVWIGHLSVPPKIAVNLRRQLPVQFLNSDGDAFCVKSQSPKYSTSSGHSTYSLGQVCGAHKQFTLEPTKRPRPIKISNALLDFNEFFGQPIWHQSMECQLLSPWTKNSPFLFIWRYIYTVI